MENPLMFFLHYLEEGLATAFLGLALLGIRPGIKQVITAGILEGLMIYLIKDLLQILQAPPFIYMFLLLIAMMVILKFINRIGWDISLAASLLSFLCLFISQLILLPISYAVFGMTREEVYLSLWKHILSAYFGDLLVFVVSITVALTGFSFLKFTRSPEN